MGRCTPFCTEASYSNFFFFCSSSSPPPYFLFYDRTVYRERRGSGNPDVEKSNLLKRFTVGIKKKPCQYRVNHSRKINRFRVRETELTPLGTCQVVVKTVLKCHFRKKFPESLRTKSCLFYVFWEIRIVRVSVFVSGVIFLLSNFLRFQIYIYI